MSLTFVCINCGKPIKDGEPFEYEKGAAWHTNLVYCVRTLRDRLETVERRQNFVRPALSGRVIEIKQGGPGETGPEGD